MAIDFPNSPTTNQIFTVGSRSWKWDGTIWAIYSNNPVLYRQDSPPSSPQEGDQWFETDTGRMFVYYGTAWVELGNATDVAGALQPGQVTALSAVTSLTSDDVFPVVDNPASATATNKITYGNLVTNMSTSISTTGGVWTDYTPTLVQSSAVTKTVTLARYFQFQKMVVVTIQLNVTGSGLSANAVNIGLPVAARTNVNQIIGSGYIFDGGGVGPQFTYNCSAYLSTTTSFLALYQAGSPWGSNPSYALASGDQLQFVLTYEAA
jgi:hypothetical protein